MQEAMINNVTPVRKNITTSRIFCVNTKHTYVYKIANGEILSEEKVME